MLTIGNLTLSSHCMLAPMSGISDLPFRLVNRTFGCGFAFVEMISARALVHRNAKTEEMLSTDPSDRPLGIQLLGNDPRMISGALDMLRKYEFDIIDFNAACPVSKVTGRGEGASLLKEPRRLNEILRVLVKNSDAPVTVKIRAGWDEGTVNARNVALYAEDAGIKGLFIHGRTKAQGYSGMVNYQVIREVKDALKIPVVASGDIFSPQSVRMMLDETGCDGVVMARGALGNPWIFRETAEFLKSGTVPERPCLDEIINTMITHLNLCADYYNEIIGTIIFRKFFSWYTKGLPEMKSLKERAFHARTKLEMTDVIEELRSSKGQLIPSVY